MLFEKIAENKIAIKKNIHALPYVFTYLYIAGANIIKII